MSAKHICPAQIRKNTHPFLMCNMLKKDGEDYNIRENAAKIACVCQHYCPCTQRPENTAQYKECYAGMKAKKAEAEAKALEEETPVITEKPKRKKAKANNEL